MTRTKKIRLIEFLVIGLIFGVGEDWFAIFLTTGQYPPVSRLWILFLVALSFAVISELVVDHPRFWELIWPEKKK